jgi:hypothetical protein
VLIGKRGGLSDVTALALMDDKPMLRLLENGGFDTEKESAYGVYEMKLSFI